MSRSPPAKRAKPTEKRRPTELRQIELVDAALEIIATRGIASLTTRTLAERVGLTGGAIFRHFASLDALLAAVVSRVEDVLDATYPVARLPGKERLDRFIDARTSAVGKQLGILRLVASEQFSLALSPDASARLRRCVERTRVFVIEAIREAQGQGTIRGDVDAGALGVIVMGTMRMLALSSATASPHGRPVGALQVRQGLAKLLEPPAPTTSVRRKPREA